MIDSQICQIESDYKQYFFKIRTFKHLEIKKKHYSYNFYYLINHRKKAVGDFLQPSKLII